MPPRKKILAALHNGVALSQDGRINVPALASSLNAHPAAVRSLLLQHYDVRTNPDGSLTWLPQADQIEQAMIAACSERLAPLLPSIPAKPRNLSLIADAARLNPANPVIRHVLAAALIRAGFAPASADAPWGPDPERIRTKYAPDLALAAAAADPDRVRNSYVPELARGATPVDPGADVLPAQDCFYARVLALAWVAYRPVDAMALQRLAADLFPTPLLPPTFPLAVSALARAIARSLPAYTAHDVHAAARKPWISFADIATKHAVDPVWVQQYVALQVETPLRSAMRAGKASRDRSSLLTLPRAVGSD